MLIAQISDLHVRARGDLYKGVVDSNAKVAQAIAHLNRLDRAPDLVLVTGDLVETPTASLGCHPFWSRDAKSRPF